MQRCHHLTSDLKTGLLLADRGASIRVPHGFVADDAYKGYLEDRRPNSQGDPYQIVSRVSKTVAEAEAAFK